MRFPVGGGSKEEFERDWYIADGFGTNRGTYFHSGSDINLRTGGDSDLGSPLYAIAEGDKAYYHFASHPTTGFGKHFVYKIEGPWGTRWVHYAHCLTDTPIKDKGHFPEGEKLSEIGKSGTTYAHLHMSVFKKDPKLHPRGIDAIAKTQAELNEWWDDPINFIISWIGYKPPQQEEGYTVVYKGQVLAKYDTNPIDEIKSLNKRVEEESQRADDNAQEATILRNKLIQQEADNAALQSQLRDAQHERDDMRIELNRLLKELALLETENTNLKATIKDLEEQLKLKDPTEDMTLWERFVWLMKGR